MADSTRQQQPRRLAFCGRSQVRGGIDGAWWPRDPQLGPQLADVISIVTSRIGPVRRVVYDPRSWAAMPSRVIVRGAAIKVDPYAMVDTETIYLIGTQSRTAILYVLPSTCEQSLGERALSAVENAKDDEMSVALLRNVLESR